MKDPIERQDAIDAINAIPDGNWSSKRYETAIKGLPPAQTDLSSYSGKLWRNAYERGKREAQPEIIRCKDCKYWNPHCAECEGIGNWFGFEGAWSENGYCYKAERREE